MTTMTIRRTAIASVLAALALGSVAAPLMAQDRDPAYAAARTAGQVGEKPNGYLGIVGNATPQLQAMVDDLNNRRRAVYTQRAQAQGATLEEFAFTSGCLAISRTEPGEKYQAPDGTWQTRTAAAPIRDPRCP
jgi:uncharacterized protein